MATILIVDDEKKMRHLLTIMLERSGHHVEQASDGLDAYEKITANSYDMVIADIKMPRMTGTELLNRLKAEKRFCPMVFITAYATVDSAVEAMRIGAVDYITKPFDEDRMLLTVERTLNLSRVLAENRNLRKKLAQASGKDKIIFKSNSMRRAMTVALKVAKSESAVLITGESGTGKELLARFIHQSSSRKNGPFVPINCAAISPHLVESELFGYEKGAFTGAHRQTQGKFESATKGTLFMDEIGDLSLDAQAKLLRALQEKKILRVGGNREIPIDVRILCATNRNLAEMVEKGSFRQDLFFRINVVPIELPPLRDRTEDMIPLCHHFIKRLGGGKAFSITEGAARMLTSYPWPGNVRELGNTMERAIIFVEDNGAITVETLSFLNNMNPSRTGTNSFQLPPGGISLDDLLSEIVQQALDLSGNNQTRAAKLLGLTRAKFRVLFKNTRNGAD